MSVHDWGAIRVAEETGLRILAAARRFVHPRRGGRGQRPAAAHGRAAVSDAGYWRLHAVPA